MEKLEVVLCLFLVVFINCTSTNYFYIETIYKGRFWIHETKHFYHYDFFENENVTFTAKLIRNPAVVGKLSCEQEGNLEVRSNRETQIKLHMKRGDENNSLVCILQVDLQQHKKYVYFSPIIFPYVKTSNGDYIALSGFDQARLFRISGATRKANLLAHYKYIFRKNEILTLRCLDANFTRTSCRFENDLKQPNDMGHAIEIKFQDEDDKKYLKCIKEYSRYSYTKYIINFSFALENKTEDHTEQPTLQINSRVQFPPISTSSSEVPPQSKEINRYSNEVQTTAFDNKQDQNIQKCDNAPVQDESHTFCSKNTINFFVTGNINITGKLLENDSQNCKFKIEYQNSLELDLICKRFLPLKSNDWAPLVWMINGTKQDAGTKFTGTRCFYTNTTLMMRVTEKEHGTTVRCEIKYLNPINKDYRTESISFVFLWKASPTGVTTDIPLVTGRPNLKPGTRLRLKRDLEDSDDGEAFKNSSSDEFTRKTRHEINFKLKFEDDGTSNEKNAKIVSCYLETNTYNLTAGAILDITAEEQISRRCCYLENKNNTLIVEGLTASDAQMQTLTVTKQIEGRWSCTLLSHRNFNSRVFHWRPKYKYDDAIYLRSQCFIDVHVFERPPITATSTVSTPTTTHIDLTTNERESRKIDRKKHFDKILKTEIPVQATTPKNINRLTTSTPSYTQSVTVRASVTVTPTKLTTVTTTKSTRSYTIPSTTTPRTRTQNTTVKITKDNKITKGVTKNATEVVPTTPVTKSVLTELSGKVSEHVFLNNSMKHENKAQRVGGVSKISPPPLSPQPTNEPVTHEPWKILTNKYLWIGVLIACCLILIALTVYVCRNRNNRRKIPSDDDSSNVTYENLNNENNQFPPNIENAYAIPVDSKKHDPLYATAGEPTYCTPYVEKDLKVLYAQPVPKSLRNQVQPKPDLYSQVQPKSQRKNQSTSKLPPNARAVLPGNGVTYAEIEVKGSDGRVRNKMLEGEYSEIMTEKGHGYGNVFNGERYANAKASEYAEPAYCQVNLK